MRTARGSKPTSTYPPHNPKKNEKPTQADSAVMQVFQMFAQELDYINDKKERLIKLSRDVTIGSKRLIFAIHRLMAEEKLGFLSNPRVHEENQTQEDEEAAKNLSSIDPKIKEDLSKIDLNIGKIASEIQGHDFWKYQKVFSMGMQEYIEAVSFLYFIETGKLITRQLILKHLLSQFDFHPHNFEVTLDDYFLGIADLTGELMRLSISSVALGHQSICFTIYGFLSSLLQGFESLGLHWKEMLKKLDVMKENVAKVENVCFQMKVRGSEYPKEMWSNHLLPSVDASLSRTDHDHDE